MKECKGLVFPHIPLNKSNFIHYTAAPLDYFSEYTPLWKVDYELSKINWDLSTITQIDFYEEITNLIINGLQKLSQTPDGNDLNNQLYTYWEVAKLDHEVHLVNIAVLFKQQNNGTTHLFTHYEKNDFPHDFEEGECWGKIDKELHFGPSPDDG